MFDGPAEIDESYFGGKEKVFTHARVATPRRQTNCCIRPVARHARRCPRSLAVRIIAHATVRLFCDDLTGGEAACEGAGIHSVRRMLRTAIEWRDGRGTEALAATYAGTVGAEFWGSERGNWTGA